MPDRDRGDEPAYQGLPEGERQHQAERQDRLRDEPPRRIAGGLSSFGDRSFSRGRDDRRPAPARPADYAPEAGPFEPGGGAGRGYGEGGDNGFGQMASGSSASGLGGYSGADVGGFGQPNLNSQWGQAGYAPLNQGVDYGQGGGRFGPAGYNTGNFGQAPRRDVSSERGPQSADRIGSHTSSEHDGHHVHYRRWRDAQLAAHDQDYGRWRDEQHRRYDEDYNSWRDHQHSTFSKEFEGWRTGRSGQATQAAPSQQGGVSRTSGQGVETTGRIATVGSEEQGFAHGANPTLANIADGHAGAHHQHHDDKAHADHDDKDDLKR